MPPSTRGGRKHPYLTGNFAPIRQVRSLTACTYTGTIPDELLGGEYVRNGANPAANTDLGRDAHWFDGDGMLSGVLFRRPSASVGTVQPEFANQYILTDLYLSTIHTPSLATPILPSIATLVDPAASLFYIIVRVIRAAFLVLLSHLAGSSQVIRKISVANTNILYHDGRALATCESGPPIRVSLPGLETVGWYDGVVSEGESQRAEAHGQQVLGGEGFLGWMQEWTTGHPKVDPITKEMILYQCTFLKPYVLYTVIPDRMGREDKVESIQSLYNAPVPGIASAKMMHDFGVSQKHTVIMDLPLSMDPLNQLKGRPVLSFDLSAPSRFGVFPRWDPSRIRWFETEACCIFHTVNTWDESDASDNVTSVNMLACRLISAATVFTTGNIAFPEQSPKFDLAPRKRISFFEPYDVDEYDYDDDSHQSYSFGKASLLESDTKATVSVTEHTGSKTGIAELSEADLDQCRLYYYEFSLPHQKVGEQRAEVISHQWALTTIPFEFTSLNPQYAMSAAKYVYGCSVSQDTFGAALGRTAKIDILAKVDVQTLIRRGKACPPRSITGSVDKRKISDIVASTCPDDPIQCFVMPPNCYAQEPRFVPSKKSSSTETTALAEDDGYLIFYVFDESQLDDQGECPPEAVSELWIIDAKNMRDVVAKVHLPQRVPYGLHGTWFSEQEIVSQRPVKRIRSVADGGQLSDSTIGWRLWMAVRHSLEALAS